MNAPTARRIHLRHVTPNRDATLQSIARARERADQLALLRAFATRARPPVFSHWSALLLHGLPDLGGAPRTVHVLSPTARPGADGGVVRHSRSPDHEVVERQGLRLTSVARTVADIAALTSFSRGVVAADRALSTGPFGDRPALCTREELEEAASRVEPFGRERAMRVARFADGRAESPLESLSRATMSVVGAPPPDLQALVTGSAGASARLDFVWPALGIAGEADGAAKGVHPAMLRGRTTTEFLADRSRRDRLIEGAGLRVVRWGWQTARDARRMAAMLRAEGVLTP